MPGLRLLITREIYRPSAFLKGDIRRLCFAVRNETRHAHEHGGTVGYESQSWRHYGKYTQKDSNLQPPDS